jgi:hypothetical protein
MRQNGGRRGVPSPECRDETILNADHRAGDLTVKSSYESHVITPQMIPPTIDAQPPHQFSRSARSGAKGNLKGITSAAVAAIRPTKIITTAAAITDGPRSADRTFFLAPGAVA